MLLKTNNCVLLLFFWKEVFSSIDSASFFLIEMGINSILVPIPRHTTLKTEMIHSFDKIIAKTNIFQRALFPPSLKLKIQPQNLIQIFQPPKDFKSSHYLQFYIWLNNISKISNFDSDFIKYALYYLYYFGCNNIELIHKLYGDISNNSVDKNESLSSFFNELKSHSFFHSFFLSSIGKTIEVAFKQSFYLSELKKVLAEDKYDIVKDQHSSCLDIGLFSKDTTNPQGEVILMKQDINDELKILIRIDLSVINDAVHKTIKYGLRKTQESNSQNVCLKIFEALEFLATEDTLEKHVCVKGFLTFLNARGGNFIMLDSHKHLEIPSIQCRYQVQKLVVNIFGDICVAKAVLNALESKNCEELRLNSEICKIQSYNDVQRIKRYLEKIEKIKAPNLQGFKLIIKDDLVKNFEPIFSEVILVRLAKTPKISELYVSFGLESFWGPLVKD